VKIAGGLGAFMYVASQVAMVVAWIGVILVLAMKDLGWMAVGTFMIPPAVLVTVWWTTVPLLLAVVLSTAGYFGGMALVSISERREERLEDAYWAERERRANRTRRIRELESELGIEVPEEPTAHTIDGGTWGSR